MEAALMGSDQAVINFVVTSRASTLQDQSGLFRDVRSAAASTLMMRLEDTRTVSAANETMLTASERPPHVRAPFTQGDGRLEPRTSECGPEQLY